MNPEDIRARHRAGLGQEESLWRKCNVPALALERKEYMDAIYGALRSLENARMALVKISQRLTKEAAGKTAALG